MEQPGAPNYSFIAVGRRVFMLKRPITNSRLIISVKEARKLMGKDAVSLSDSQIEDLIITLTEASNMLLSQIGSKKTAG